MNGLTILVTAATGTERTGDAAPRPARSVITAATSRALTMQSSLDGSAAAPATSCSPLTSPVSVGLLGDSAEFLAVAITGDGGDWRDLFSASTGR
jgi:uncharacterized protein YfiM (DUF2279 family)